MMPFICEEQANPEAQDTDQRLQTEPGESWEKGG